MLHHDATSTGVVPFVQENPLRILIVEESKSVSQMVGEFLSKKEAGTHIHFAHSTKSALGQVISGSFDRIIVGQLGSREKTAEFRRLTPMTVLNAKTPISTLQPFPNIASEVLLD